MQDIDHHQSDSTHQDLPHRSAANFHHLQACRGYHHISLPAAFLLNLLL